MAINERHESDSSHGLIEREGEIATLDAFVGDLRASSTTLALVGQAGIGKTTLLRAAARTARGHGARVAWITGMELEADLLLAGLHQLLAALDDVASRLAPRHREVLAAAAGRVEAPAPGLPEVAAAAAELLLRAADRCPLLLVVDDPHWIDRATADVVHRTMEHLRRVRPGARVGVLIAMREDDGPLGTVSTLPVGPLSPRAAARLAQAHQPALTTVERRRVVREADGNPVAVQQLATALSVPRRGTPDAALADTGHAGRIERLFAERLTTLPAASRRLLLLMALARDSGRPFVDAADDGIVAADALAAALERRLVATRHGTMVFRHPLVGSAVLGASTAAERREAHLALAEALTPDGDLRVWHLSRATSDEDEEIASLLERAAHDAVACGDAPLALDALLRAADLSPSPAERSRRLAASAFVAAHLHGELADAPQLLISARKAVPGQERSLEAATAAAYILVNDDGDVDAAHRLLHVAVERWGAQPDVSDQVLADALETWLAVCWFSAGRVDLWHPFLKALARLGPRCPPLLGVCASLFGDPAHADDAAHSSLREHLRRVDDAEPGVVIRAGRAAFFTDQVDRCRPAHERVIARAVASGASGTAVAALVTIALDDVAAGRWAEARRRADQGLRLCEGRDDRTLAWPLWLARGVVAAMRGDDAEAAEIVDRMRRWAMPRGARIVAMYADHIAASAALARCEDAAAFAYASAISPPGVLAPYVPLALWSALDLVQAAWRIGEHDAARAHAEAMRVADVGRVSPRFALVTAFSEAITAPETEVISRYETALQLADLGRWPFESARLHLAYGEALRRRRAVTAARPHLSEAAAVFERLGARRWSDKADSELAACLGRTRRAPESEADWLTPQERAIAVLAAQGLTNKEIARRLQISPRTVGGHLHRVFPKLGITARGALRTALARDQAKSVDGGRTSARAPRPSIPSLG